MGNHDMSTPITNYLIQTTPPPHLLGGCPLHAGRLGNFQQVLLHQRRRRGPDPELVHHALIHGVVRVLVGLMEDLGVGVCVCVDDVDG